MHRLSELGRSEASLLFEEGRTFSAWRGEPVRDELLAEIYHRASLGPTSLNCQPMRVVFVRTDSGKRRLLSALNPGNIEKTLRAPVTAIIGYDLQFYRYLPTVLPGRDIEAQFTSDHKLSEETAFRNGTLQGAYLMLAARSVGLDVGPMSGFDKQMVNREFFEDGSIEVNFLCNLGYGDRSALRPRGPRLPLSSTCQFV